MPVCQDITNTIGRAPLVKLHRIAAGLPATIALIAILAHYRCLIAFSGEL